MEIMIVALAPANGINPGSLMKPPVNLGAWEWHAFRRDGRA
jgi:hypothetical protein